MYDGIINQKINYYDKKTPAERGMARHLRSCYPEYIKTKKA